MERQSGLGTPREYRAPDFNQTNIGRVTSIKDFYAYGRIEVVMTDMSRPAPVWVVGDIDREPVEGDFVIVGYINGRKDAPYLVGFVKNSSYTTNFVMVKKDIVKLQVPIFEVGVKDGIAHKDVQMHLTDQTRIPQRAVVEISPTHAYIQFPVDKTGAEPPAYLKINASGIELFHPTGNLNVRLPKGEMTIE